MNKYAVAVLSFFQNENKIFLVEAENDTSALIAALNIFGGTDNQGWLGKYSTVEEIKEECFNGEIAISSPLLIQTTTN